MQLLITSISIFQNSEVKCEQCVTLGHGYNEARHSPTIITSSVKPHDTNADLPSQ